MKKQVGHVAFEASVWVEHDPHRHLSDLAFKLPRKRVDGEVKNAAV